MIDAQVENHRDPPTDVDELRRDVRRLTDGGAAPSPEALRRSRDVLVALTDGDAPPDALEAAKALMHLLQLDADHGGSISIDALKLAGEMVVDAAGAPPDAIDAAEELRQLLHTEADIPPDKLDRALWLAQEAERDLCEMVEERSRQFGPEPSLDALQDFADTNADALARRTAARLASGGDSSSKPLPAPVHRAAPRPRAPGSAARRRRGSRRSGAGSRASPGDDPPSDEPPLAGRRFTAGAAP